MSISMLPANPLPDCSKPVQGTEMYPGGGVPFQPDSSCNSVPCKLLLFVFMTFDNCNGVQCTHADVFPPLNLLTDSQE